MQELLERLNRSDAPGQVLCLDVGATGCLRTDAWLLQAVRALQGLEDGQSLLVTGADFGVTLRRGRPFGALGQYDPATRTVTISGSLDTESDWERATVLAHELQHANDHASGVLLSGRGGADCLAREQAAFKREARVWQALWKGNLPEPSGAIQAELNKAVAEMDNPAGQARSLAPQYVGECAR